MTSQHTDKTETFDDSDSIAYIPVAMRIKFITPLVSFIVILVFILLVSLFYVESESQNYSIFHDRFTRTTVISDDFYKYSVETDASAIRAIMSGLKLNKELSSLFATGNRNAILEYAEPLYKELNRDYNITHFYFTGLDRANILRVHAPSQYGDTINRITTIKAQQSKKVSHGVELGVLGTLTLRVVSPWYSNEGKLIGYLELGMEIDHVIEQLQKLLSYDIDLYIHKEYLQEQQWKSGMRALNRRINWEQFDLLVATKQLTNEIIQSFIKEKEQTKTPFDRVIQSYDINDSAYWMLSVPIDDVQGRNVANMLLLADTTFEANVVRRTITTVGIIIFILTSILLFIFSKQVKKVSQHIKHDEILLKQMATKDSLTNLYTRRIFNDQLSTEIVYSKRYNTRTSLIMLDIDHFKLVNDNYGHPAGDMVLRELSKRIIFACRETDSACRFGGEEFVIIAKNTPTKEAENLAERLRLSVEATPFDIGEGKSITVTISIGIASYPEHADCDTSLIIASDKALYTAKKEGRNCVRIA
jgi:diguanylate cyclase (GGDEF)-like protein